MIDALLGSPVLFAGVCLVLGLLIGSFLNVVACRLPVMLEREWSRAHEQGRENAAQGRYDLAVPASHCPRCHAPIAWYHNIPLLSWLWLRGRCASCRTNIPASYPLMEATAGLIALAAAARFGPGFTAVAAGALALTLLVLARIDAEHMLLPDAITLPGVWAGLLVNTVGTFTDLHSAVIGAVAGYLVLWLVYQAFKRLTGKEGMGYGDFKLLALLGAWLGWQALPACLLIASVVGAIYGIGMIAIGKRGSQQPFPFGPFLALAGWINLMWGAQLQRAYLSAFS